MKIGTKSLLFGVHAFWIHPITVAIAWIRLYGFPFSIPIWTSFFVHDFGYWGKPNMDGKEGETHVELGANIMHKLFDPVEHKNYKECDVYYEYYEWYDFTLYHSRFYANTNHKPISKLCIADKYAFCILPKWLYIMLASWSGEIYEYMHNGRAHYFHSKSDWYWYVYEYMIEWIDENNKF